MHYIKYKEIKSHGTAGFPMGYYHVNRMHPQYAMPYHWHDELEFIHIIEGNFHVTVNENAYLASPGDILIVNGGFLHGGIPYDCIYECLVFPCGLLLGKSFQSSFLDKLNMQDLMLDEYYPADDEGQIPRLIKELFLVMGNATACHELIATGLLHQIMGHIQAEGRYSASDKADLSRHKNIYLLKQVLNYIERHYPDKIQLNTLARIAGMSPKYFCRFFHEMTAKTPIDYVNYYRIERACYLLVNSDATITEISLSCGFNDISYFIKTFKKYKGKSPKRYLIESM